MAEKLKRRRREQFGASPRAGPERQFLLPESTQAWDWPEARPSGDVAVGRRGPDPLGSPMTQSLPQPDARAPQSETAPCWIQRLRQCAQDGIHTSNAPPLRRRFCRSLWAERAMDEGVSAP